MIGLIWQAPVFDRTAMDLADAYQIMTDMKSNRVSYPYPDLKCFVNASTLNRIENNLIILSKAVGTDIISHEWSADFIDQPTVDDKERILANANSIKEIIESESVIDIPELPENLMTYSDFNAIEECIDIMSDIIFHPLRTTANDRLVIADDVTPMTVDVYETSATQLNGSMIIAKEVYEDIEHDSGTHYIVVGTNEVIEYIGDTMVTRRGNNG